MIPEGSYTAVALEHRWGKTSTSKHQLAIQFEIVGGEYEGNKLVWYGYFTDRAVERTLQSLRYCGWVGHDLADLGALDKQVQIVVEHDTYNGNTRAKIAWVNELGIALKEQMTVEEVRQFAASMRSRIEGMSGPPKQAPAQGFYAPVDDDVPF